MSDESVQPPAASDNGLASSLDYTGVRTRVKFDSQYLKHNKVTFTNKKIVNMYLIYKIVSLDKMAEKTEAFS